MFKTKQRCKKAKSKEKDKGCCHCYLSGEGIKIRQRLVLIKVVMDHLNYTVLCWDIKNNYDAQKVTAIQNRYSWFTLPNIDREIYWFNMTLWQQILIYQYQ